MTAAAALLRVRVAHKAAETADICALTLAPAEPGQPLPAFEAGAHIDVHLPGGWVRPYSLCNAPAPAGQAPASYTLGVLREAASRGGSLAVHALHVGQTLTVSAPRNLFPLAPAGVATHHLLMAGGIGLTPLLAMAEALHQRGEPFTLHLSTRSRARTPFLTRLAQAPWAAQVVLHPDDDPAGALDLAAVLSAAPAGAHLYVCGPQGYIAAVLGAARAQGWAEARLHSESFAAAEPTAQAGDQTFEVVLARRGLSVWVEPGQTVARALDAAGVRLPTACEQGICGTCLTPVLEGVIDHRDQYLTPEEQAAHDQFLPCCSRAKSARVVIDL